MRSERQQKPTSEFLFREQLIRSAGASARLTATVLARDAYRPRNPGQSALIGARSFTLPTLRT